MKDQELILEFNEFSGPLDLLYKLIKKQKIEISDIPIVKITNQFLNFINKYSNELFDQLSEYLVLASKLTLIKARMLLPQKKEPKVDEDPRFELRNQLLAYEKYVEVAKMLRIQEERHKLSYTREEIFASDWHQQPINKTGLGADELLQMFIKTTSSVKSDNNTLDITKNDIVASKDVKNKIAQLLSGVKELKFSYLLTFFPSPDGIVACLVEILKLNHLNKIYLLQKEEFGDIILVNKVAN